DYARLRSAKGAGPYLEFLRSTPGPKTARNRVHLDVAPYPGDDQAAEVARLRALGATDADVGQGDVPWTVLADPEGNEFCVLTPRLLLAEPPEMPLPGADICPERGFDLTWLTIRGSGRSRYADLLVPGLADTNLRIK